MARAFRDQGPFDRAYDVAVHDGAHRRDPRRHGAQHRAARLQLRFRDPPPALRRSRGVLRRGAGIRRALPAGDAPGRSRTRSSSSTPLSATPGFDTRRRTPPSRARPRLQRRGRDRQGLVRLRGLALPWRAIPAIVCGPGHIAQAHQPNEWIALEQLARCEAFMRRASPIARACAACRDERRRPGDAADRGRRFPTSRGGRPATPAFHTSRRSPASAPGPHVLLQALTHGNEVCGAIALDWLLARGVRPCGERYPSCFANVDAYERFDPRRSVRVALRRRGFQPAVDRGRAGRAAAERRARARARVAAALRPRRIPARPALDDRSCPPLAMAGRARKGVALARALGYPEHIVVDAGHAAGKRLRDYAFFDDPTIRATRCSSNAGSTGRRAAPDVAKQATLRFLAPLRDGRSRVARRAPRAACRAARKR